MTMVNERFRKTDRSHVTFFSLLRNVTKRSKSLDNLYDHKRRKEGKTK